MATIHQLDAAHSRALDQQFRPRTLKAHRAAARRWAQFVVGVLNADSLLLFDPAAVAPPSPADVRVAEAKMMAWVQWLHMSISPASIRNYLSSFWAQHQVWMRGRSLRDLGVDFAALRQVVSIMTKREPPLKRTKRPFSAVLLARLVRFSLCARCATAERFRRIMAYAAAALALEQLLRISEVTRSCTPTTADGNPMRVQDLVFLSAGGRPVRTPSCLADGIDRELLVTHASVRCPDSKSGHGYDDLCLPAGDPLLARLVIGRSNGLIRLRTDWDANMGPVSACRALWFHMALFPGPAPDAPLFRVYAPRTALPSALPLASFKSWFKAACVAGGVEYKQFGSHCFRVGGMVAMQQAGASVTEVMAQGRWRSDVWAVYCRRDPATARQWASIIMAGQ